MLWAGCRLTAQRAYAALALPPPFGRRAILWVSCGLTCVVVAHPAGEHGNRGHSAPHERTRAQETTMATALQDDKGYTA